MTRRHLRKPLIQMNRPIACVTKFHLVRWSCAITICAQSNGSTSRACHWRRNRKANGSARTVEVIGQALWSPSNSSSKNWNGTTAKRKRKRKAIFILSYESQGVHEFDFIQLIFMPSPLYHRFTFSFVWLIRFHTHFNKFRSHGTKYVRLLQPGYFVQWVSSEISLSWLQGRSVKTFWIVLRLSSGILQIMFNKNNNKHFLSFLWSGLHLKNRR